MKSLSSILNRIIKENNWQDQMLAYDIEENWKEIFGEKAAKMVKLKKYENKVLYLRIENPTWKMEIMLRKPTLIEKINEIVENNIVEDIVIH
jgi:predicted nucleic acid-binding Zn ribbon protein